MKAILFSYGTGIPGVTPAVNIPLLFESSDVMSECYPISQWSSCPLMKS